MEEAGVFQGSLVRAVPDDRELASLIHLLDDPDPEVSRVVDARIYGRGPAAMGPLLEFADLSSDGFAAQRAKQIASRLNVDLLMEEFGLLRARISAKKHYVLEDGAFLIARFGNPRLDVEHYRAELTKLAAMLKERVDAVHSPFEVLTIANGFFFDELKYRGNQTAFLEPENSYLDRVIDRRIGIPISLCVVFLLIARSRLNLPFSGVAAPGHFLLRYDAAGEPIFIDAFNGGVMLSAHDVRRFLEASGMDFSPTVLTPAPAEVILKRMLRNLIMVFTEREDVLSRSAMEGFVARLEGER